MGFDTVCDLWHDGGGDVGNVTLAGPARRGPQLGPEPLTHMGTFVNEKVWMYRGERTGKS